MNENNKVQTNGKLNTDKGESNKEHLQKPTHKKKKKRKRKRRRKKRKPILIFIKYLFLGIFILVTIVSGVLLFKLYPTLKQCYIDSKVIIENMSEDDFKLAGTSHVFDCEGNEMFEIKSDKDLEYLKYSQIPQTVKDAFIAVEDRQFFEHKGINYKSLMRAAIALVKNDGEITQGGSTITQQLVKLTYLSSEQTYTRKFKEILISRAVEKKFSKEQILEFYINNIYFNNNAYGIAAAAQTYFDKSVNDLSLAEITFLCAIPNNPTLFDPYVKKENTIKRQQKMLNDMLLVGSISESEYDNAIKEEITVAQVKNTTSNSYDTRKDFVKREMCELIMAKNGFEFDYTFETMEEKEMYELSYSEAYNEALGKLYRNGVNIYTSFDNTLQEEVQNIIDTTFKNEKELNKEGIYQLQAASVILENDTGLIKTMIGGRTSPSKDYLDRSYNTYRQNGSTMKPIGVYGPAFDVLNYVPTTVKNDSPITNGPKNASGYYGNITLRKAIEISSNTVAYKTFRDLTPEVGLSYLQNMQFANIVPEDMKLQTSLGGLTIGTNPKEMAAAYATIANNGQFNPARCIVKIETTTGKRLYTHKAENIRIYEESSAYMLTDSMKGVLTNGTAKGYTLNNNIESAGKTGTTNDNFDGWFVGYSPKYTASVWIGYDNPRTVNNLYGALKPVGIWKQIMDRVHVADKDLSFEESDSIEYVYVNSNGERVPEGQGTLSMYPKDKLPPENKAAFENATIASYKSQISSIKYTGYDKNYKKEQLLSLSEIINNDDTLSDNNKSYLINVIKNEITSLFVPKTETPTSNNSTENSNNNNTNNIAENNNTNDTTSNTDINNSADTENNSNNNEDSNTNINDSNNNNTMESENVNTIQDNTINN